MFNRIILFLFISAVYTSSAKADTEFHLLEVDKVSLEQYKIMNHRDPYWDYISEEVGEQWTSGGAFNLNLNFIRWDWFRIAWTNRLHMESTTDAIRSVGWQFEVAAKFWERVSVFHRHHSQHLTDAVPNDVTKHRYPLEDYYGVEVVVLKRD